MTLSPERQRLAVCLSDGHVYAHGTSRCRRCNRIPVTGYTDTEKAALDERINAIIERHRRNPPAPRRDLEPAYPHGAPPPLGIPEWHGTRSLEALEEQWDVTPAQQAALDTAKAWMENQRAVNPKRRGLLFLGPTGTGKTSIMAACAAELGRGMFRTVRGLYAEAKAAMGTASDPWLDACRTPWLFLDDLGADRDTEWRMDELRGLISARYDAGRPIVATGNMKAERLAEWLGERAWSRLSSTVDVVGIPGADRRVA